MEIKIIELILVHKQFAQQLVEYAESLELKFQPISSHIEMVHHRLEDTWIIHYRKKSNFGIPTQTPVELRFKARQLLLLLVLLSNPFLLQPLELVAS